MTLTTIIALLQSALLLLTAAQSSNLPQSFRDNAMAVAQHAISQATAAIASNAVSTSPTHTFTTPSGAVVDASGNVTSAPAMSYTAAPQTNSTPTLSISSGQVITTTNSAYISWTTNMPATSKVFITKMPVDVNATTTQVLSSAAGMSTQGFVNISNLTPNTQYSYTIEAITDTQNQKIGGTFSTDALPPLPAPPTCTLNVQFDGGSFIGSENGYNDAVVSWTSHNADTATLTNTANANSPYNLLSYGSQLSNNPKTLSMGTAYGAYLGGGGASFKAVFSNTGGHTECDAMLSQTDQNRLDYWQTQYKSCFKQGNSCPTNIQFFTDKIKVLGGTPDPNYQSPYTNTLIASTTVMGNNVVPFLNQ